MDKMTLMGLWIDKIEKHHIKLNTEKPNLIDNLYADCMRQIRNILKSKGWDETEKYLSSWIEKATGTNMMGPHHLRNAYMMVVDKMRALDKKTEIALNKEYGKLVYENKNSKVNQN